MTERKPVPMEFNRNNLSASASPYLLQHGDNPVWWQEWKPEVLACAVRENKPLLVSSGYSTCHWCHVMAAGAFSDPGTAAFLNEHFICIKIDREQRPDIDQFMMEFILSQNGTGGWPLNLFMTPGGRPVFALMFAPAASSGGRLSFLEVARQVLHYFDLYGQVVPAFTPEVKIPRLFHENSLIPELFSFYDAVHGGFGQGQKFPPHATLLFLLYHYSFEPDTRINTVITGTLDAMRLRGLNDHLRGGVFRYCVDRAWTIPHFEKMLYDQALALWCYSLAWKVMGVPAYKTMAEKILQCLDECFAMDGCYITAFNADTNHEEGATYLWSHEELSDILTPEEFKSLCEVYVISPEGNLDGKIHLVRKNDLPLDEVENKLLAVRKMRPQPSKDDKILCGVNALTAIALIHAGRYLEKPEPEADAALLVRRLLDIFLDGTTLGHSLWAGSLQKQGFLSDASAMLLAVTLLYENDVSWLETMSAMAEYVGSFRENGKWIESRPADFQAIEASWSDHPAPSGISLAETGLTRAALLTGKEPSPADFRLPFFCDFFNINVMLQKGMFHLYTSGNQIPWGQIPANSLQKRGKPETDCYKEVCSPLEL